MALPGLSTRWRGGSIPRSAGQGYKVSRPASPGSALAGRASPFHEATPEEVRAALRLLQLEQWLRARLFGLELEAVRGLYARTAIGAEPMRTAILRAFAYSGPDGKWQLTDAGARARNDRLLAELDEGAGRILQTSEPFLRRQAERAYRAGYYGRAWVMANLTTPESLRFGPIPTEAIDAAINAPYEGSNFFMRMGAARGEFIGRMRRAVATSQAQGDPIGRAMQRLSQELGWNLSPDFRYPVGHRRTVRLTGLTARLEAIARTEIIRTSNMGMEAVMQANADVLRGWEWISARDKRTCPICGPLDGRVFALASGQQRPPRHTLCRCSQAPAVLNPTYGPRETYADWAAKQGVRPDQDGGLAGTKPAPAPQAKLTP